MANVSKVFERCYMFGAIKNTLIEHEYNSHQFLVDCSTQRQSQIILKMCGLLELYFWNWDQ